MARIMAIVEHYRATRSDPELGEVSIEYVILVAGAAALVAAVLAGVLGYANTLISGL